MRGSATAADVADVRLDVVAGLAVDPRRLTGFARQAVALAVEHGAALGPVLDVVASVERAQRRLDDEVRAALAPVQSVAVALAALPVVLVPLLGRLVAVDLVAFYGTGVGRLVALVVLGLWLVGVIGVVAVVRGAGRRRHSPWPLAFGVGAALGLVVHPLPGVVAVVVLARRRLAAPPPLGLADALELAAVATSAGLPLGEAVRRAVVDLDDDVATPLRAIVLAGDLGRSAGTPGGVVAGFEHVAHLVDRLAETGGPPSAALRTAAEGLRRDELADARTRAARLPTRLTFPTVLGLLPATVLAIGAPLVSAGLASL